MASQRILFVSSDLPWPPDGGGRIASFHVLEAFSQLAEVDLIALADLDRPIDISALERICRRIEIVPQPFTFARHRVRQLGVAARSALSLQPYRLRKFRNERLRRTIDAWTRDAGYDLVHHEQLGVAPYRNPALPSTGLAQNAEFEIYRRAQRKGSLPGQLWAMLEGRKLARAEPAAMAAFDHLFVLTEDDRRAFARAGVERISVVPMPAPPTRPPRDPPAEPVILSLGSMSWFGVADGLRWFHDEVLPRIRARVPGVRWDIVGPGASSAIQRYADEPGTAVHGYAADLAPFIDRARVAIVPLHVAGGIRMKLLDTMAWGLPAVATPVGAQGLDFEDGEGCLVRDGPEAFADAVVRLLVDDDAWRATADGGRSYLERTHSPGALEAALAEGISAAIAHHAGGTTAPGT